MTGPIPLDKVYWPDTFWRRTEVTVDGCWRWTGSHHEKGYGLYWDPEQRKTVRAHRFAYEYATGSPVPFGLVLDHTCRVRDCVNPHHAEPVTVAENIRRGLHGVLNTHCPSGHEYTDRDRRPNGYRRCLTCDRERNQRTRKTTPQPDSQR